MTYRTVICVLLALAPFIAGCGVYNDGGTLVSQQSEATPLVVLRDPPLPTDHSSPPLPVRYLGEESIEERIANADIIVKARLDRTTQEIITTTEDGLSGRHFVALRFHLRVSEYLKGSGANEITALWVWGHSFDTQKDAKDAAPDIVADRNAKWDDRETVLFLAPVHKTNAFRASVQGANEYLLAVGGQHQDMYSLYDRNRKLWLPSAQTNATEDNQDFLLTVPGLSTPKTISLEDLKGRIAAFTAELNRGDGSPEYAECVRRTYEYERKNRYDIDTGGDGFYFKKPNHELDSGLAASSVVNEQKSSGYLPDEKERVWFDGGDADLFGVEFGDAIPRDSTGDGVKDAIIYDRRVVATRPLPAGVYKFHFNNLPHYFVPCDGFMFRYEWTVTVNSPEGTLHELFFDPVTVGSAAAADATNGVLSPTIFTDANDWSVIVHRISFESDTVMIKVYPYDALDGHIVDFIELDGTVSLSLDVDDATVDAANNTLSWNVAEQPWHDGDKLMVRIREAR